MHCLQIGFQKYLMYSLFIGYENDERRRFVLYIVICFPSLIPFYCVCFVSFSLRSRDGFIQLIF